MSARPPGAVSAQPPGEAVRVLAREAASLVARLRLFTPARWEARSGAGPAGSRADAVHHLAQALVDLGGEAPVPLPLLGSPLALPDQLAVVADDLVRTDPPDDVADDAVAHLLLHRADLLAEPPPTGLVAVLGAPDVEGLLARGREVCARTA